MPNFVDINNTRETDQLEVMQHIIAAGHCPFCQENLEKYHTPPILWQGTYWLLTTNRWPYAHTKYHWLFIALQHSETFTDLPPEAGAELWQKVGDLQQEYTLPGGGLALRFGDTRFSAGTVKHLHAQLIVPDVESPDFQPVRVKLGTTAPEST